MRMYMEVEAVVVCSDGFVCLVLWYISLSLVLYGRVSREARTMEAEISLSAESTLVYSDTNVVIETKSIEYVLVAISSLSRKSYPGIRSA